MSFLKRCRNLVVFSVVMFMATVVGVSATNAATGDISAVRINSDGWSASVDISNFISTSTTNSLGFGTNNDPTNAKISFNVTSAGYDASGSVTTITRTIYGTKIVRLPYPNAVSLDEATSTGIVTIRVALSDFVYSGDTSITATMASGWYTDNGTGGTGLSNNAVSGLSVTNNSGLSYPKTIANWSYPGWTRITGSSFKVRAVAFNRSGQQGLPVRVVKFTATDQHSHSVSTLVTLPTIDNTLGDAAKITEYIGTLTTSTFTAKDLITINFAAYPWVGDSGAVMDTSDAVHSQPTPLYAPIFGVYDDGTYGTAAAVVDATGGNDGTCVAVAESAFNPASPPLACATINKAAKIINTFNNTNYTRNDAAGTIYMKAGNYNWTGANNSISATVSNAWNIITTFPGVDRSSVVITGQSGGQAFGGTKIKLQNITINVATNPVSVFDGITYLWFDNCSITMNGTAPVYQVQDWYITDSVSSISLLPFSTVNSSPALIRGNDLTGTPVGMIYTVIGNTNNALGSLFWENEVGGSTAPASNQPILAYNTFYKLTSSANYFVTLFTSLANPLGAAIVQNLIEANFNGQPVMWIAGDSTTNTPVNNVMLWYNTMVGQRINRAYNSTGSASALRSMWSEIGELRDQENIKTDTFTADGGANGARVGNWSMLYGVGRHGTYDNESTGVGAAGAFMNEFGGLYSYHPTLTGSQPLTSLTNPTTTIGFVRRLANDGITTNTGGGNYQLLSSSPARNLIPSGQAALPYDLAGNPRYNNGKGAAGAYEYVLHFTMGVPMDFLAVNTGLIGWWTFDGKDLINTVADRSGSGNFGRRITVTSTTTAPGIIGQAYVSPFSVSTNAYIDTRSDYVGTSAVTICLWAKLNTNTGNFLYNGKTLMTTSSSNRFAITRDWTNTAGTSASNAIVLGKWQHYCSTSNAAGTSLNLYVNGQVNGTANQSGGSPVSGTTNVRLLGDGAGQTLDGSVDDMRVYNRVLSATEITQLYNLGTTKASVTPNTLSTNSLIGWWTFDGPKMISNVADSSGQGNNGNIVGATTTTVGKIGQALSFDGTSSYVDIAGSSAVADNLPNFTASVWFNTSSTTGRCPNIILGKVSTGGADLGNGWGIQVAGSACGAPFSANMIIAGIESGLGSNVVAKYTNAATYNDGKWHNVVMVVTGGNTVTLYVDGSSAGTTDVIVGTIGSYTNSSNIRIGNDYDGEYFAGSVDDTRLYNRALSAAEARQLYLGGR